MVRITESNEIHIKIVYWGMAGSGKTTILETLHKLTKDQSKDIIPVGDLNKISQASGATLYFDKGIFQSVKQRKVFYNVFTVAGQDRLFSLRQKVFLGTDGVILVLDSQTHLLEDNLESLKELKAVSHGKLIKEIPLIIMLNKQDLQDVIKEAEFIQILKENGLWYNPPEKLSLWNPLIYETCALFEIEKDIYRSFAELSRRTGLYQIYGDGKAPLKEDDLKLFVKEGLLEKK